MNVFALRVAALLAAGTSGRSRSRRRNPMSLGQKAKLDGIISGRSGDTMTVKTDQGNVVGLLTENTDVSARKGRLGLIRKGAAATALIPGLKVEVEGVGDDKGRLIATKVRFLSGDLETARAIQAGLAETGPGRGQPAGNRGRTEAMGGEGRAGRPRQAHGPARRLRHQPGSDRLFRGRQRGDLRRRERGTSRRSRRPRRSQGYMIGVEGYADATGGRESTRSSAWTAARRS